MNTSLTPYDVTRQGVTQVTSQQAQHSLAKQTPLKVICKASLVGSENKIEESEIKLTVGIEEVPVSHPFALVNNSDLIVNL